MCDYDSSPYVPETMFTDLDAQVDEESRRQFESPVLYAVPGNGSARVRFSDAGHAREAAGWNRRRKVKENGYGNSNS